MRGRRLPIPPQCEGLDYEIQQLEDSKRDIGDVPAKDKAAAIEKNLQIQEQIVQLQEKLYHCIVAFGGAYSTDVVIFDVGGGPVTFPLERRCPALALDRRSSGVQSREGSSRSTTIRRRRSRLLFQSVSTRRPTRRSAAPCSAPIHFSRCPQARREIRPARSRS